MEKSMIIVGAGIAGISTGCYARMNGYKTTIFELHNIPGGLCTAWKRKGYTFDVSMHMLTGSKGGAPYKMWQELGVIQDQKFFYRDEMGRVESGDKSIDLCVDPKKLEQQMLELSPADAKVIKEFVRLFTGRYMMGAMSLKPAEMTNLFDKIKMVVAILPMMRTLIRYGNQTIQEFVERFQDPFLRDAVRFVVDSPGWPMLRFPMVALAGFAKSAMTGAGVPVGGSQQVLFRMAGFYKNLGGEIFYKKRVADIIVENDRAVGVVLQDGAEHRADSVVWAGDGHTAIFDILGGRYVGEEVRHMYDEWLPVLPMIHVMLGVNRDLSDEPNRLISKLENPITIAGQEHRWLTLLHRCFDPSMAPAGKSAVEVWYATDYDYWAELAKDRPAYEAEKKRIADFSIAELDKRRPGFARQIEVVDVSTPTTYVRYTANWQGSPDGWYITPENMSKQTILRSLPGLDDFYMVGQWTQPFAGTVMSALSGRQLIQLLCKQEQKKFVTEKLQ